MIPSWLLRKRVCRSAARSEVYRGFGPVSEGGWQKRLIPHQIQNGGNIITVQVENEVRIIPGTTESI